jgi:FkbM family methyltransferase
MFEEIFLRKQYHFPSENECPVILDVGSNIGLSILYFKKLFRDATIIGFEPDPDTFAVLSRNMAANGLDDVVLRNEAVHDRNDRVDLYGDPERPGSPRQSTSAGRISGAKRSVRATRLSDHMLQPIDFLKLDVEGAELTVVDELERSGKLPLVERMAIEYHHHLDEQEDLFSQLLATLERAGFGYQLEARIGSVPRPREYQNILVRAYRKDHPVRPPHRG